MAPRIIWTDPALADLKEIRDFIRRDSARFARAVVSDIRIAVKSLRQFPLATRMVPEYGRDDTREIIEGNYRIIIRVAKDSLHVIRVLHTARDLTRHFDPSSN